MVAMGPSVDTLVKSYAEQMEEMMERKAAALLKFRGAVSLRKAFLWWLQRVQQRTSERQKRLVLENVLQLRRKGKAFHELGSMERALRRDEIYHTRERIKRLPLTPRTRAPKPLQRTTPPATHRVGYIPTAPEADIPDIRWVRAWSARLTA
eukprot:Sspe_Gene.110136::Locus_90491_Transcript_3_4_Confidence_0.400_Length_668::g.110136::m.110136